MLREPKNAESRVPLRKDQKTGRFQVIKLEERIAPRCKFHHIRGEKVGRCRSLGI